MTNIFSRGTSLAIIASMLLTPIAAQAQTVPGGSVNTGASAQPAAAPSSDPLRSAIVTRDTLTGRLRAPHQGEHSFGVISPEEFARMYPDARPGEFENIRSQDRAECAETGENVREAISILAETRDMMPELQSLRNDVAKLGGAQNRASLGQVGTAVISTGALCALTGGLYCLAAGAAGLGNILGIGSHSKTQKVDRRARDIDARTRILDNRTRVLDIRERLTWEKRMHPVCIALFPGETTGVRTAVTYSSW